MTLSIMQDIVSTQVELNNSMAGKSWVSGITREGRLTAYDLNVVDELMEMLNSHPYKHWSDLDKKPDIENAKLELADTLCFMISHYLQSPVDKMDAAIATLSRDMNDAYERTSVQYTKMETNNPYALGVMTKELIVAVLVDIPPRDGFETFFKICMYHSLTLVELSDIYNSKVLLNLFRQQHGYRTKEYTKLWKDGKEDNYYLMKFLKENKGASKATIANFLTKTYKELGHG
jgi:hypothetical protein